MDSHKYYLASCRTYVKGHLEYFTWKKLWSSLGAGVLTRLLIALGTFHWADFLIFIGATIAVYALITLGEYIYKRVFVAPKEAYKEIWQKWWDIVELPRRQSIINEIRRQWLTDLQLKDELKAKHTRQQPPKEYVENLLREVDEPVDQFWPEAQIH